MSSSGKSQLIISPIEFVTLDATPAPATLNYDVLTQEIYYLTSSAINNFILNFRGNANATLNSVMAIGSSRTCVLRVTNGATPYYPNTIKIDGSTVTPKVNSAISAGNANSIDIYIFIFTKTADATFSVEETQTKFS